MAIVVFEDDKLDRLYPVSVGRLGYTITCGGFRLIDWLQELQQPIHGVVRPHLTELQACDFAGLAAPPPDRDPLLMVNARLAPSRKTYALLTRILNDGRPGVVRNGADTVIALVSPEIRSQSPLPITREGIPAWLQSLRVADLSDLDATPPMFDYPHDIIRYNQTSIGESLAYRLERGVYREIAEGVFAAEGASFGLHCVTNTKKGPILLDEHAMVGPFCYLSGPAYLGKHARINEHSAIKDGVALGHTTKIGGEVEASVVEAYSNKQHHGFLGHSYLGSWINLGAGTCNSDLKNTYGVVKMEYRGEQVATGMQFVGCMIGDYAKTAINTGIFTGKTIGTCSMVYGFVTTNVPSFVNYARLFGQVTELTPEVMVATQQRMFLRRKVTQRPCDIQLLHAMYELTRHERQLAGEPLSL
ncbi:MAG: glucose-1-phosphate thymidylyltransferase [Planctomycetes bacterium]|nr:glucose-1-phosphate thymidylyltransferase [Planctomycetota bacterium]